MSSIRCRAACNKALRPTVRSKLSPSGDAANQTVAFARRFVGSLIAMSLVGHSRCAGIVVAFENSPRARRALFNAPPEHETDLLRAQTRTLVVPAKAGTQWRSVQRRWIRASAGMTGPRAQTSRKIPTFTDPTYVSRRNAAAAARTVSSMSSAACADETNPASNADGAR
jgi:hypothetical protein